MKRLLSAILILTCWISPASAASLNELQTAVIKEDYQTAKKLAQELINDPSLKPQELNEAKFYLALSHLTMGECLEGRKILEALIKEPLDVELRDRAYLGLFNSYYLNEEYRDALRVVDELYKLSPQS